MMHTRTIATCALGFAFFTQGLDGQSLSQYRDFTLGSSLAAVSTLASVAPTATKTIHQRPAVLQDLQWRPSRWTPGTLGVSTDPVEQILFSFYDDQLFRLVVDYARERTEGMTDADMVAAISTAYGTPLLRASRTALPVASQIEAESGTDVARWGDAEHSVALYRTSSYGASFRLIVAETRLENLARKARAEALRLDDLDAPRREVAREKKRQDDDRAAAEKARTVNKGVFRP